jgi:hypothetical protein
VTVTDYEAGGPSSPQIANSLASMPCPFSVRGWLCSSSEL